MSALKPVSPIIRNDTLNVKTILLRKASNYVLHRFAGYWIGELSMKVVIGIQESKLKGNTRQFFSLAKLDMLINGIKEEVYC
jgi:hypothetical protein